MPLIRYRTGDMSRFVAGPCACGRQTPMIGAIQGRAADFVRTPDGRLMPGDGVMEAFYGIGNVKESQVVQRAVDRILVRLVPDDPAAPVDEARLRANMTRCLGSDVAVEIEFNDWIWEPGTVKKRWVVSEIAQAPDAEAAAP